MNDPQRLLDGGADELESRLLRAGRNDAPSASSRREIAAGLGVAGLLTAGTVASGAGAHAASTTVASGTAAASGAKATAAAAATKLGWLGTGVALRVTVAAIGGALAIYAGTTLHTPSPPPAPSPPGPAQASPAPRPAPQDRAVETPPAPEPAAEQTDRLQNPAEPARAPAERATDTLSLELATLDAARGALARGNETQALAKLDEYSRRFPRGRLTMEATVLRVDALLKSGDCPAALRLGQKFVARHPNGPYAKRVRSLMGEAEPTTGP